MDPVARPSVKNQMIEDPNRLAGLTTGEGCLFSYYKVSNALYRLSKKSFRFFGLYPDSTRKGWKIDEKLN